MQVKIEPSFKAIQELVHKYASDKDAPNMYPLCATLPADFLVPTSVYLKLMARYSNVHVLVLK